MRNKPTIPKGMRDFTPDVIFMRNYILETVKSSFERYGYAPIETPAMEKITTLSGKYGDEGDRLIFKILNSGDFLSKSKYSESIDSKSLAKQITEKALRYDLTVPFARFVAQNRNKITFPFRRYQMQNVWRADKPQKGRFREFFQCDADIIGSDSLFCEVELIQIYDEVFTYLNVPNIEICLNNRKILIGIIELMGASDRFNDIVIILDKLSDIGIEKLVLQMKEKGITDESILILKEFLNVKNIQELPDLLKDSIVGSKGVQELLFIINSINDIGLRSANLKFDITLARGLDYYTGCILEVKSKDVNFGSVGGGGRYDDLTAIFGMPDISGVGISFGIDRIFLLMEELNLFPEDIGISTKLMFVNFGEKEAQFCLSLLKRLRDSGINSELYPNADKMKKQMNYANNKGIELVVLIGENEMDSGLLSVKNMKTGDQYSITIDKFINEQCNV
jgi:histidyl-tRNA synthetase